MAPQAQLDRDDRDGFGQRPSPFERSTLRRVTYVIDDYTHHHRPGAANFLKSGARVLVYMDGVLKAQVLPPSGTGNLWSVFVLRQGKLKLVNKVSRLR